MKLCKSSLLHTLLAVNNSLGISRPESFPTHARHEEESMACFRECSGAKAGVGITLGDYYLGTYDLMRLVDAKG